MELKDAFARLDALDKRTNELGSATNDLRDALIVTAEIQRRQAEVKKTQAKHLLAMDVTIEKLRSTVHEFADKLNGLIGYIDNLARNQPNLTIRLE